MRVKIYGERNTGTNYLSQLFELNTDVTLLRGTEIGRVRARTESPIVHRTYYFATFPLYLGWKHRVAPSPSTVHRLGHGSTRFVCLVKNPYAWVLSMYRRPYESDPHDGDLRSFIERSWAPLPWENRSSNYRNTIELWNAKVSSYFGLIEGCKGEIVRYEDLLIDAEGTFTAVLDRLGIPRGAGAFENVTRGSKRSDSDKTSEYYREYYLNHKWAEEFDDATLARITELLDGSLVDRLGYPLISSAPGRNA